MIFNDLYYTFTPQSFKIAVQSDAVDAQLVFPIVATASETIEEKADGTYVVQKKAARLQISSSDRGQWKSSINKRIFNFVPGFEAVPLVIPLNTTGYASLQIKIIK